MDDVAPDALLDLFGTLVNDQLEERAVRAIEPDDAERLVAVGAAPGSGHSTSPSVITLSMMTKPRMMQPTVTATESPCVTSAPVMWIT